VYIFTTKRGSEMKKHIIIGFAILTLFFAGVIIGWNMRSANQANAEAESARLLK
jgi:hypothetical protein